MEIPATPFEVIDWSALEPVKKPGDTGHATWRTVMIGDVRVRRVDYSPGYLADHWCERGHILFVLDGELETEIADGRKVKLTGGMSYQVSNGASTAHRSSTTTGAQLFIVD